MVQGHVCDAPVRVTVDQEDGEPVALPIIDDGVGMHYRKDGPLSFSRRAEVDFALRSENTDWFKYINAYSPEGGMQQATVYMKTLKRNGEYDDELIPVLRGYIGGVGSSGDNVGHLTIFGPFKFLQHIAISEKIRGGSYAAEFLYLIAETLNERQEIMDDIGVEARELPGWSPEGDLADVGDPEATDADTREQFQEVMYHELQKEGSPLAEVYEPSMFFTDTETFNRDEHTLASVAERFLEKFDMRLFFFTKRDGTNVLVGRYNVGYTWDTTADNENAPPIVHNNAIYEMKPFNAVLVKGDRSDNKHPEAIAWYPPLTARADGKIAKVERSSANSPEDAEAQARSILKEGLDGISGGTMHFTLTPGMHPFDSIKAQPACAGIISSDLPALDYEIERVAHIVDPNPVSGESHLPQTEVAVSMDVVPSKMESKAAMVSNTPAEDSPNVPSEELNVENFKWGI